MGTNTKEKNKSPQSKNKIRKAIGIVETDIGYIMLDSDNNFFNITIQNIKNGYKRDLLRKIWKTIPKDKILDDTEIGVIQEQDGNVDYLIHVYKIRVDKSLKQDEIPNQKWLHLAQVNELVSSGTIKNIGMLAAYLFYLGS
ncbi:rhamnulokinase [Ligilactobacillus equi]|uniref:Rhamnulokinase n=1 Tax=Ligilactobacillus equi DPC 6820 TaxID=1392007 RepID=V7HZX9_9LACO|nr:rhamnulokinase [Ligilactobacillus equi]ETA74581.1 rhamnulokinase [Ligilactobacillus equi DPC 6820]